MGSLPAWADLEPAVPQIAARHPRSSTAGRLRAQAEGRHYSTFSLYPPDALCAAIATFLARLPGPEVCWVDEHLLVVVGGRRRNQAEPNDSSGLASQAIKDPALQISAGRAGEASGRPLSLATRVMIEKTRNLVQPAGAAVLAAPQAVRGPEGGNRLRRRQHRASAADGAVARSEGLTAKQMPVEASNPAITATRVLSIRPCPSGIAVDARLYQREGETAGADRRPGLASRPHPAVTAHVPGPYEGRYATATVIPEARSVHNGAGGRAFAAIWDLRRMDCRAAGRAGRSARSVMRC